jgi:hypothetical protein
MRRGARATGVFVLPLIFLAQGGKIDTLGSVC